MNDEKLYKALLFALAVVCTAVLFRANGTSDVDIWLQWGRNADEFGITGAFAINRFDNYPPLPMVILWACFKLARGLSLPPIFLIKLSLLVCLLLSTWIVYRWSKRSVLGTALFYCVMSISSLGLAYLDIYVAPWLLWSFFCLQQGRVRTFAACFSLACLTKYPPLIVAPFFAIYLATGLRRSHFISDAAKLARNALAPSVLPILVALAIFRGDLVESFRTAFATGWLSAAALNFNWIVTRVIFATGAEPLPAGVDPTVAMLLAPSQPEVNLARALFVIFFGTTCIAFMRRPKSFDRLLFSALMGSFAYFTFAVGAHENHLFLASLISWALFCVDRRLLPLATMISIMSSANMFVFYGIAGSNACLYYHPGLVSSTYSWFLDAPSLLAVFNTTCFLAMWTSAVWRGPGRADIPRG